MTVNCTMGRYICFLRYTKSIIALNAKAKGSIPNSSGYLVGASGGALIFAADLFFFVVEFSKSVFLVVSQLDNQFLVCSRR